ncbi:hypothetical protein RB195_013572 [Necator americanus]|uniref:Uncharacterized protein n=1 Tax=Necator americanus TaxID=51031 RepID=A0ABR1DW80_NECAM
MSFSADPLRNGHVAIATRSILAESQLRSSSSPVTSVVSGCFFSQICKHSSIISHTTTLREGALCRATAP